MTTEEDTLKPPDRLYDFGRTRIMNELRDLVVTYFGHIGYRGVPEFVWSHLEEQVEEVVDRAFEEGTWAQGRVSTKHAEAMMGNVLSALIKQAEEEGEVEEEDHEARWVYATHQVPTLEFEAADLHIMICPTVGHGDNPWLYLFHHLGEPRTLQQTSSVTQAVEGILDLAADHDLIIPEPDNDLTIQLHDDGLVWRHKQIKKREKK